MIKVIINNESYCLIEGSIIDDVVALLKYKNCCIWLNGVRLLHKQRTERVKEGDNIKIIRILGGG